MISLLVAMISFETVRMLLAAQKSCHLKTKEVMNYPEIAGNIVLPFIILVSHTLGFFQ